MSDFELSESYHHFFNTTFAEKYLSGSAWYGHSQIPSCLRSGKLNYIAAISNDVKLDSIRHQVAEFHQTYASQVNLICAHQHSLERFLILNRSFANRLQHCAWQSAKSAMTTKANCESDHDDSGWVAWHMMQATADLYHDPTNDSRLSSLLPHHGEAGNSANLVTNHERLSLLYNQLSLPEIKFDMTNHAAPPLNFPDPVAIYLKLDQLILVSKSPLETITTLDPQKFAQWLDHHSAAAIQVCSPGQLVKAIESEDLITARLMSYQHIWGANVLSQLVYEREKILQGAAKVAAYWQLYGIGAWLFTTPLCAETDHQTIHDLQNRLLNIRLQNELFSRFNISPKGIPKPIIPDRSAPIPKRINAIKELFDWWTDFYLDQI